jgi:hypothetical protein
MKIADVRNKKVLMWQKLDRDKIKLIKKYIKLNKNK